MLQVGWLRRALRDEVTRVIIVQFVGGQVTNVEQNKELTTDFSAHKNVDVWLFVQLLYTSGSRRNGGKHSCYKCSCFEVLEQAKYYKSESLDARLAGHLQLT